MMRGLGTNFDDAINILNTYHNPTLFCTLLESSAILDNSHRSAEFIESIVNNNNDNDDDDDDDDDDNDNDDNDSTCLSIKFKNMIRRMIMMIEPEFITACLMIAVSSFSIDTAYNLIIRLTPTIDSYY